MNLGDLAAPARNLGGSRSRICVSPLLQMEVNELR
jgi:hypothetical protein